MKVKEIRLEHKLTQKEISDYLMVSRGTYASWEAEVDSFPIKRLIKFCILTNTSMDYILELTEEKKYPNMKDYNIEISKKRLKEVRKKHHHTQQDIARKFSIDQGLVSKYENGEALISTTFLVSYAKLYNISTDYLLGRINKEIPLKEEVLN